MGRTCCTYGEDEEVHTRFWWENLKDRPLGRTWCRWKDDIKIDLKSVGRAWIGLM
jgi:hypothetical protein